jgi:hypothetical protein
MAANCYVMRQIRLRLVFVALGASLSVAILTQRSAALQSSPSPNEDDRVLNAPYSAQRHFTNDENSANGRISHIETGGSKARDSQGRTYSADERRWTYLEGGKSVLGSEMLYEINDPVAHTDTRWDSSSKMVKVIHASQSAPGKNTFGALCQACLHALMNPQGDAVEKLGLKTIGGVVAEGTRSSYTVPAGQDHNDQPIVVVHERWYCPELKIVILETNDDPRSGRSRDELVDIVRAEPDVTKYQPPTDYVVRNIRLP